jgi:hypothetical protein
MPACPNCGRQTLRTKDWACQWCGYPLLSRSYKKIDKTFKELQEERSFSSRAAFAVPEPESEIAPESDLDQKYAPEPAPEPDIKQQRRVAPEPTLKPELERPPETVLKPAPAPPPVTEPLPEPALRPVPESLPEPAPRPAPQLAPKPVPETLPKPEPASVAPPKLDTITEGTVLSVDDLDALFKANRLAAHAKLAGKTIVITGFVEKVFIRDHIDVRYIVLTGARKSVEWPVRCTFGKESVSQMERLAEGQEVTLRGKYDSFGKNIIFKDCVLA